MALPWKPIVLLVAGLAGGLAISKLGQSERVTYVASASAPELPTTATQPARGPSQSGEPALDQGALRRVVREELTQALANSPAPAQPAAPAKLDEPDPSPAPSQATIERFDSARVDVEQGIRRGAWTASDREKLQSVLGDLTPEMREALLRPLVVAANEGRLKVETQGPLF